jgi:hypothetical protein
MSCLLLNSVRSENSQSSIATEATYVRFCRDRFASCDSDIAVMTEAAADTRFANDLC